MQGNNSKKSDSSKHFLSVLALISRLEGVRETGPDRWIARCPAHDDRAPSLSIREAKDGKLLLHCFSGCTIHEICDAVGVRVADLFPPENHHGEPERVPFNPMDVLRCVVWEAKVICLAADDIRRGHAHDEKDRKRIALAHQRLSDALRLVDR